MVATNNDLAAVFTNFFNLVKNCNVEFIDLRFYDILGKDFHITVPIYAFLDPELTIDTVVQQYNKNLNMFDRMFDASSVEGWQGIECSDMIMRPDFATAFFDPFYEKSTIAMICDVIDPSTNEYYAKCPRGIARKAQEYLKTTGIADTAYWGPEPEFFVFDSVEYGSSANGIFYKIESDETNWNHHKESLSNFGHKIAIKDGYCRTAPLDSLQDMRSHISIILEQIGIPVELHHHETATAGQCEIGTKFNQLVTRADWTNILKYVVKQVATLYGKTATFMPKPIVGDNGSGMHVHQSLWKEGINIFAGDAYCGLSQDAIWYIGGIIKHGKALNAFTNPSINSYKRLVPGFEAPVILTYAMRNRSAAIRIPHTAGAQAKRIETRFPDPMANSYLAFSALMLAGIDGIKNKINPADFAKGAPHEINLYKLSQHELQKLPQVASSLEDALLSLQSDHNFLVDSGVFTKEFIDGYIELKMQEVSKHRMMVHPIEFEMYYSL